MQNQAIGVDVVLGRRQLKAFVGACHPYLQPGLLAQFRQPGGNLAALELLQLQVVGRCGNRVCDGGRQSGFGIDEDLCHGVSAPFEFAVALFEQALSLALGELGQFLAQAARATFEARGGQAEFFAHQGSRFFVRQGEQEGFEQIAVVELRDIDAQARHIRRGTLPKCARLAIRQLQPFGIRPVAVGVEQFELGDGVGLQVQLRPVAADLLDKGLYVLVDREALERVGQKRRQRPCMGVHLAQDVFVGAADG